MSQSHCSPVHFRVFSLITAVGRFGIFAFLAIVHNLTPPSEEDNDCTLQKVFLFPASYARAQLNLLVF